MFGHRLIRWSVGGTVEFLLPRWSIQSLIVEPHILRKPYAVFKSPGLGVTLQRHAILRTHLCVLVLCIGQTSKALQIQHVAAVEAENATPGAVERTRTSAKAL